MKSYNTLDVSIHDFIATIWLNRPDVQNAINNEMLNELVHCFTSLESMNKVRVVVIRGKGKSFSAGADLKRMLESNKLSFDENLKDGYRWAECFKKIYDSSKPTIAVATGNIFGGGNGLLSVSDIVVAETNAAFSFSEVKIGLAPSTILPYVLTRMNEHKAKYLMFTGRKIRAHEALEYNLVDFVVADNEIESILKSITSDIVNASPSGINEIKILIKDLKNGLNHNHIKDLTANSIAKLKMSDEAYEGISAFVEKRLPAWIHKY